MSRSTALLFAWLVSSQIVVLNVARADEDVVGQAVELLFGTTGDAAAVPQELVAPPPPPAPAAGPAPALLQRRQERLEADLQAFHAWMVHQCSGEAETGPGSLALSDDQLAAAQQLYQSEIQASQSEWQSDPTREAQIIEDTSPLRFSYDVGVGAALTHQARFRLALRNLLTVDQNRKVSAAESERRRTDRLAATRYAVTVLDRDLYLTPRQRESVDRQLTSRGCDPQSGWFSVSATASLSIRNGEFGTGFGTAEGNVRPLRIVTVPALLNATRKVGLSEEQQSRLNELKATGESGMPSGAISLAAADGIEGWREALDEEMPRQRKRFAAAAALRIAHYQLAWNLTEKQVAHLQAAARGTTVKCLSHWKQNAEGSLQSDAEFFPEWQGEDFDLPLAEPDVRAIDSHPLWLRALRAVAPGDQIESDGRADRHHAALAGVVVARLDCELWFRPEQRVQMEQIAARAIPASIPSPPQAFEELSAMKTLITGLERDDAATVLDRHQLRVWDLLRSGFLDDQSRENQILESGLLPGFVFEVFRQ